MIYMYIDSEHIRPIPHQDKQLLVLALSAAMGHEQDHGAGHLLLFPFLAQGHLIPFLNLARRLESQGRRRSSDQRRLVVTIVSTPRNVADLRRAVPAGSSIGFAELPFSPSDHGLPPDAESTDAVPLRSFPAFYMATELLRPSFEELVAEVAGREGRQNVCVLADIFLGWTAESARALGVQHRVFLTSGAYASALTFSIWLRPPPAAAARTDSTAEAYLCRCQWVSLICRPGFESLVGVGSEFGPLDLAGRILN